MDQGSNGSVGVVKVNGVYCIQKRVHDILLGLNNVEEVSQDQWKPALDKFYNECKLLWKMRHPNVVQYLGIHYYKKIGDTKLISLVMEYVPSNMEKCIEGCNKIHYVIPFSLKLSILRDITCGLSHLHANHIIHRDLSAANVLLTFGMKAKLADLGVSKLMSTSSVTLTRAPGAPYIMPPEALEGRDYTEKLDIFSFGIVSLYLLTQSLPMPDSSALKEHHLSNKQMEIGKRLPYIKQVESKHRGLGATVMGCLLDSNGERPNANKLAEDITKIFHEFKLDFLTDVSDFIKKAGKEVFVSFSSRMYNSMSNC